MSIIPTMHIIDPKDWERKDHFNFFKDFLNPCISVTSEVACGAAKARAHQNGQSFFLTYLHAILRAANEIKELRFRLDNSGRILYFDTVDVQTPIRIHENGQFYSVRIPYHEDFEVFHAEARRIIANIPPNGNPFDADYNAKEENRYNVILVSATPDLYFTSINHTQERQCGGSYPLLNVGKAITREGQLVMPIAIYVHHGFVDGAHLAEFYRKVEEYLR